MEINVLLAEAFRYPQPGLLEQLEAGLKEADKGPAHSYLSAFLKKVGALSLPEWEEICTCTLDLSPAAAPYIGFQIWGESYQRGEFMAQLNKAMAELDIDTEGELPDHLVPVLRYLAIAEQPVPALTENFSKAVDSMIALLREKDKGNPYILLLEATRFSFKTVT